MRRAGPPEIFTQLTSIMVMARQRTEMSERVGLRAGTQTTFCNEKLWLSFRPRDGRGRHYGVAPEWRYSWGFQSPRLISQESDWCVCGEKQNML